VRKAWIAVPYGRSGSIFSLYGLAGIHALQENGASCSFDDRPALLLRKSAGRNVRAPRERLVGNAHLSVTYPVKADTDQYHRDESRACGK